MIRPGRREPHRLPGQYAARVSNGRMTASAPDRTVTAGRADPAGQADPADRAVTVTTDVGPPSIDVTRLRVAIARVSRSLRRHELAGLTPTQLSALATVEQAGPLRLGDLAAAEKIAPSTLTRLVTVLEERGYVARQPVPGDARASTLVITPEGHAILEQIRRESTILLADNLRTLSPDELTALAAALPALERIANPSPPDTRHR